MTILTAFTVDQGVGVAWNNIIPIATNGWVLRGSPQTTLNPTLRAPIGASVSVAAGVAAFRVADVGKYLVVYGGVIRLTVFTSTTAMTGIIESVLSQATTADPPAADAGTWTLETTSWSLTPGYPRTGEFYQGRLYTADTVAQPVTFWGSRSDDFDNNAIGVTAEDAVAYTMASPKLNRIEWLAEHNKALMIGTSGAEFKVIGSGADVSQLIGGNNIPSIERIATNGCAPIQPKQARRSTLYIDRSRRKVMMIRFELDGDGETATEISVSAEHITQSGVRLGPMAFTNRLDPRLYFVREDGQLVAMTFFPEQRVVAFSRRVTDGTCESVAVIPTAAGGADQVWAIMKRTINGVTKRYVELFEESHELLSTRPWTSLQTDCATVVTGVTGTSITGLSYLEGKTVDVVKNGSALAQAVVTAGAITVTDALIAGDVVEIGLHYESKAVTMRPSAAGAMMEGLPRSWDSLFARVQTTKGGHLNGEPVQYPPTTTANATYTGDVRVFAQGWDTEGRMQIEQRQPYPMIVLAMFGTLSIGSHD